MTLYSDDFNRHSEAMRLMEKAQDLDDLNHARSKTPNGRNPKHIHDKDIDPLTGKSKAEKAFRRTLDWLLANDNAYRQSYEGLMTALREGQSEAQTALDTVLRAQQMIDDAKDNLMSKATKLRDGRAVFKDKDGQARFANGEYVPDDLAATIQWRDGSPAYEEIEALNIRSARINDAENELRGIQAEFGDIHADAINNDEPFSPERIQTERDHADGLRDQIKQIQSGITNDIPEYGGESPVSSGIETTADFLVRTPTISIGQKY